jgi:hypothetical protein
MVVSAYRDDLRYDVPDESGRVEKAIASFQAAGTGDCHIGAGPGAHTRRWSPSAAMCCGLACRNIAVAALLVTNGV